VTTIGKYVNDPALRNIILIQSQSPLDSYSKNRLSRETGNSGHNAQNEDKEIKKYNTEN
jgi:hypothetical protein